MRISDWSSDVCSSDLKVTHCLNFGDAVQRNRNVETVLHGHDEIHDRQGIESQILNDVCPIGDGYFDRLRQERQKGVADNVPDLAMRHGIFHHFVLLNPKWNDFGRSDEQTSELQSLMRIT